jgi:hypothetical protein
VKRVLHLTLKKEWFDLIASGKKHFEYREVKSYWTKRLFYLEDDMWLEKVFDEIYFRNGYGKNVPFMRVEYIGLSLSVVFDGKRCYSIKLGKILELKNYGS